MKQEETEEKLKEEVDEEEQVHQSLEDAFKKASQIEHIDDSQMPQSIKDLFKR